CVSLRGADHDQPRDADLELPVEEAPERLDVEGAPVLGERRDRHGVASPEVAHGFSWRTAVRFANGTVAMLDEADVVVIGGGITGCAAAYELARAGVDVALVERHDLNTQA